MLLVLLDSWPSIVSVLRGCGCSSVVTLNDLEEIGVSGCRVRWGICRARLRVILTSSRRPVKMAGV